MRRFRCPQCGREIAVNSKIVLLVCFFCQEEMEEIDVAKCQLGIKKRSRVYGR